MLAFFAPIENNFIALVWLFALNFLFGLLSDVLRGNDFSMRKAITCLTHATMFFALCASLYGIGHFQNVCEEMLNQCVSSFCWILVYCYSTNIVRNIRCVLRTETPAYRTLDLLCHNLSSVISPLTQRWSHYTIPHHETQGLVTKKLQFVTFRQFLPIFSIDIQNPP